MPEQKQSITLAAAWLRYEVHVRSTLPEKKAEAHLAQTRTALLRYTLPGWGFSLAEGARLTAQECERGLQFLEQVALEQLKEASMLQEQLFEQLGVAGNSRRNYRWALQTFIAWCQQQVWSEAIDWAAERRPTSRQRERKGSATSVRTTPYKARVPYQLSKAERTGSLQQELEDFNHFFTQPQPTIPQKKVTSVATFKQLEQQVLRLLGWLHKVQGLPGDALSLETLIPTDFDSKGKGSQTSVKETSRRLVDLVQAYLEWLQKSRAGEATVAASGTLSSHTVLKVFDAWLAVARFVHRQELSLVGWKHEEKVSAIAALKRLRQEAGVNLQAPKPISEALKKRLDWTEFLDLSEKLRLECRLWFPQKTQSKQDGTTRGGFRSLTAIAQSYQRFLCVALLAYLLPRRQQELRQLKVSSVADSGLQPDTNHDASEGNFLYLKGKQWWIKLAGKKKLSCRLDDSVLVPNLRYADGRCFYQYLEEWLLQYDYQADQGKPITVPGLRSCFQPQHDYLFTQKNGRPYTSAPAFMALLRNPAYRLTGKVLTPQEVPQMFITHLVKTHELSKLELKHLAQMMGHSYKALVQQYEDIGIDPASLPRQEPEHEAKKAQAMLPELQLQEEDRQWAAETAQAFLNEKVRGESNPQKVVSASFSLP